MSLIPTTFYEIPCSGLSEVALTKKNGTDGLIGWLTDGSETLCHSRLVAWGIMKDVFWFPSKEKSIATHAENKLYELVKLWSNDKRKIVRIETLRPAY